MNKWVKIGFPIVCVVVVGGTLIALGKLNRRAIKHSQDALNNAVINNDVENTNIASYNYANVNQNTNTNVLNNYNNTTNVVNGNINTVNNNNVNQTNTNTNTTNTNNVNPYTNTNSGTPKVKEKTNEEKAIELVSAEWGEDSSVYYSNEGQSSGNYIVAVRDKSTTAVKMFYKVDLENKKVEVDW